MPSRWIHWTNWTRFRVPYTDSGWPGTMGHRPRGIPGGVLDVAGGEAADAGALSLEAEASVERVERVALSVGRMPGTSRVGVSALKRSSSEGG
ncbi:UNVERIFIED_ORG: hypothetical protein FHR35_006969 [Microbispora rosea subsp. rosea]